MLCILIPVLVILIGLFLRARFNSDAAEGLAYGLFTFGGIVLFVALLMWPIHYMCAKAKIYEIEELRKVYESDELKGKDDRAGILAQVAKANGEIASSKYLASSLMFNWYWPEEIKAVKPIEQ